LSLSDISVDALVTYMELDKLIATISEDEKSFIEVCLLHVRNTVCLV